MALSSIASRIGSGVQTIGQIPFIFILIAIEIFFYLNGAALFPNWDSSYGTLIGVYVMMTIIFLFFGRTRTQQETKLPLQIGILSFTMAFFITFMILTLLVKINLLSVPLDFPKDLYWQTIIIQVCVVATSEELMFRGVMLDILTPKAKQIGLFAIITSSLLFALWHSYAYQIMWYQLDWASLNWLSVGLAFVFGLIMAIVAKNRATEGKVGGLPATIAIHACYNLIVIGCLLI